MVNPYCFRMTCKSKHHQYASDRPQEKWQNRNIHKHFNGYNVTLLVFYPENPPYVHTKQHLTVQCIHTHTLITSTSSLTYSLSAIFHPLTVAVLHSHRWDDHRPDAAGATALHRRGRQRRHHRSQRWAVVAVAVVEVMVGAVSAWGRRRVRCGGAFHRVTAALRAVVLGHAGDRRHNVFW